MPTSHHTDPRETGRKERQMASITTQILCPCGCEESVSMTDKGFSATTVEIAPCSTLPCRQVFGKSDALGFQPAVPTAVRHIDGLVVFA